MTNDEIYNITWYDIARTVNRTTASQSTVSPPPIKSRRAGGGHGGSHSYLRTWAASRRFNNEIIIHNITNKDIYNIT